MSRAARFAQSLSAAQQAELAALLEPKALPSLRSALARQHAPSLDALRAEGGAFLALVHGLPRAQAALAGFPPEARASEPLLLMMEAVNAFKSGNLALADLLVSRLPGPQARSLAEALALPGALDPDLACFRFMIAIYADEPIGPAELDALFGLLARLPQDASVPRGLLYNVALDVFVRRRQWDIARETAARAQHHFTQAGAVLLAFYIELYQTVIALATGALVAAAAHIRAAEDALARSPEASSNDRLLTRAFGLVVDYERGKPAPWVDFLLGPGEAVPYGELWPSIAEPLISAGRRALASEATVAAALAYLGRWRLQALRSRRFARLIALDEVQALQGAGRWAEADELLAAQAAPGEADWKALSLASQLERAPKSVSVARGLEALAAQPNLPARLAGRLALMQADSAAARGQTAEAVAALSRLAERLPPAEAVAFYREHREGLSRLLAARPLIEALRRAPRLASALRAQASEVPTGPLTRQELRILRLMAEGAANKTIAARLGLAEVTVKFHARNLMRKLGAGRRAEAVRAARQQGLLHT